MTPIEHGTTTRFLGRSLVLGLVVFGAVRLAIAGSGVSGGSARSSVTVSGTLTGVPGAPMATFHFRHGATEVCSPPPSVTISNLDPVTHSFSVEVPIDNCPALFDGSDVSVTVDVNGVAGVVSAQTVNPVPYAHYASQYGTPDCPVGYERDTRETAIVLCRRCRGPGRFDSCYDDVVRVGMGASAFWIDRYEASVWATPTALPGSQRGDSSDDYAVGSPSLSDSGAASGGLLFARSAPGVNPSRRLTWFQANVACGASGKKLPRNSEWTIAAQGTPDPPNDALGDGREARCITNASFLLRTGGRAPAVGTIGCQSVWGAQDMIGNVWEFVDEWMGSVGSAEVDAGPPVTSSGWPGYVGMGDAVYNVTTIVFGRDDADRTTLARRGLPAAISRGGQWNDGTGAGILAVTATDSPVFTSDGRGFRCMIPR